jgi:hypothetical protein
VCAFATENVFSSPRRLTSTSTLTVTQPTASASLRLDSGRDAWRLGTSDSVRIEVTSLAPRAVYATRRRAGGAPCASSYSGEDELGSQALVRGEDVIGGPTVIRSDSEVPDSEDVGAWLVCAWVAEGESDPAPVWAGSFAYVVDRPCVVPRVRNLLRGTAVRRIRAAGCRIARTQRVVVRGIRSGRAVGTRPPAGRRLAPGAAVTLLVRR